MEYLVEQYQTTYRQLCNRRAALRHAMSQPAISRQEYDALDQRQQLLAVECEDLLDQLTCMQQYPAATTGGAPYVKI